MKKGEIACAGLKQKQFYLFKYKTKQRLEDNNKIEGGEKAHLLVI